MKDNTYRTALVSIVSGSFRIIRTFKNGIEIEHYTRCYLMQDCSNANGCLLLSCIRKPPVSKRLIQHLSSEHFLLVKKRSIYRNDMTS